MTRKRTGGKKNEKFFRNKQEREQEKPVSAPKKLGGR